jgi:hypothetical protein
VGEELGNEVQVRGSDKNRDAVLFTFPVCEWPLCHSGSRAGAKVYKFDLSAVEEDALCLKSLGKDFTGSKQSVPLPISSSEQGTVSSDESADIHRDAKPKNDKKTGHGKDKNIAPDESSDGSAEIPQKSKKIAHGKGKNVVRDEPDESPGEVVDKEKSKGKNVDESHGESVDVSFGNGESLHNFLSSSLELQI